MTQAEIAQLVEHFTRNEGVVGSSPIFSFPEAFVICIAGGGRFFVLRMVFTISMQQDHFQVS